MPKSPTSNGGRPKEQDVNEYSPPQGPTSIDNPKSPGLHGDEPKKSGTQGRH